MNNGEMKYAENQQASYPTPRTSKTKRIVYLYYSYYLFIVFFYFLSEVF